MFPQQGLHPCKRNLWVDHLPNFHLIDHYSLSVLGLYVFFIEAGLKNR